MFATRIPLQDGLTVLKKAIDIVDDAAAIPRCAAQYCGPAWLRHRSTQRRPEDQSEFVDAGGRWICYARVEAINGRLEDLLQRPKSHRMPNLLIVGDTNNGKTALVNRFLAKHQPQAASDGTTSCIPIICVQAPPLPDERRFYQAILSKVFALVSTIAHGG